VLGFATTNDAAAPARGWRAPAARSSTPRSTRTSTASPATSYDAAPNRTIAVSTVAISEALQKVYGDTTLARELSQQ
jgi:hypothetical protein